MKAVTQSTADYLNATHACPAWNLDIVWGEPIFTCERWEPVIFIAEQFTPGGAKVYRYRHLNPDGILPTQTFYTHNPLPAWGLS